MIVIDTGVGNRKPRAGRAHGPAQHAGDAVARSRSVPGPQQVTHVVMTHLHTDHVGWNTVEKDGRWVPTFPKARYLFPKDEFDYWKADYDKGDKDVNEGSFVDSVLPIARRGSRRTSWTAQRKSPAASRPSRCPVMRPACCRSACARAARKACSPPTSCTTRSRSCGRTGTTVTASGPTRRWSRAPPRLKRAAERGALIMPMHLGAPYCGYVRRQGDGYAFEPAT